MKIIFEVITPKSDNRRVIIDELNKQDFEFVLSKLMKLMGRE